jgi:hypothetical protein
MIRFTARCASVVKLLGIAAERGYLLGRQRSGYLLLCDGHIAVEFAVEQHLYLIACVLQCVLLCSSTPCMVAPKMRLSGMVHALTKARL